MVSISPLGDSAMLISFVNMIDENINRQILSLFERLKTLKGVKDIVPAYCSIAIYYDIKQGEENFYENFEKQILPLIDEKEEQQSLSSIRTIKVPVCYSEVFAIDIKELAIHNNLSPEEVIRIHTERKYRVYMIGFLPGFAYMGEVDERIAMPRRSQPRTNIEAGSVGIAGRQTGIYPLSSPGGWQIIGRTPLKLFDKEKQDPVLFQPGDEVEFYSISEDEYSDIKGRDL